MKKEPNVVEKTTKTTKPPVAPITNPASVKDPPDVTKVPAPKPTLKDSTTIVHESK